MKATETFENSAASVGRARRFVASQFRDLDAATLAPVVLMVSELAANCVRHAATGFRVTVERSATLLRVSVEDDGLGIPELRSPPPLALSGRGLQLVDRMSDEWGITPTTGSGKSVWFVTRLPSLRLVSRRGP